MPFVRGVSITGTRVTISVASGVRTFDYTSLPAAQDTPAKAEAFMNAWAASNITECQVRVHVYQRSPLRVLVGCFNLGAVIPDNWWEDNG